MVIINYCLQNDIILLEFVYVHSVSCFCGSSLLVVFSSRFTKDEQYKGEYCIHTKRYDYNLSQWSIDHGHRVNTRSTGVTEINLDFILNTVVYYNEYIMNDCKQ